MVTAVLFDLDCTLVDRVNSIRQYALRFAEDFCHHLVPTSREGIAEVLIAADGLGYRTATRTDDIAAHLAWAVRPAPDEIAAHWRRHFTSLAVAMDGAVEVLETLQRHGIPLGGCPRKPRYSSRWLPLVQCKVIITSPCYRVLCQTNARRLKLSEARGKTSRPWAPQHSRQEAHSPEAKRPQDDLVLFVLDTVPRLDVSRF